MQYQFHPSKETEHTLEKESLVKELFFCCSVPFPSCFFSNCMHYSTHRILISNISNLVVIIISNISN